MSNFEQYSSVFCETTYSTDPNPKRQLTSYPVRWILGPFPTFEATITNNTGHVIRFNRAVIKLQDESGNTYDCLSKQDLTIRANNVMNYYAVNKGHYFYDTTGILGGISILRIIDNNFELLPNNTQKGYIYFNLPPAYDRYQYDKFMGSHQYFKLLLYELPVEADQAGEVKKTTNYEFYYDIKSKIITK